MATRIYLPASGTAPLGSLAIDASWGRSENLERRPCGTTKSNTSLTQKSATWAATATNDWVWVQFQSKRLAAGYSWTTGDTVSMVIKVAEAAAQVDSHLAYCIRVVSGDGSTVRGTIGVYQATSSEYPVSLATIATRIHDTRTDGASNFSSQAGDRIIIEIGHYGVTPTANVVYHDYGDPTAVQDQILTAGETTDYCPWVELSQTVSFDLTTSCPAYIKGVSSLQTTQQAAYMVGTNPSYPASTSTPAYIQGETYPLNTIKDDFDDSSLDTNKWTRTQFGAILSETNQRIQVSLSVGLNSALLASRVYYDLTDSSAIVEAWNVESTDGYATLILYNSMTNNIYIGLDSDSGEYYTNFGANIDGNPQGSVLPYDAVNHRWWKIRHIDSTNSLEFYLSADGVNWGSSVYSISTSIFPLDCVLVKLDVGNYGGGLTRTVYLDNFNILKAKDNTPAYIVGGIIPTPAQQWAYIQGANASSPASDSTSAFINSIGTELSSLPAYVEGASSGGPVSTLISAFAVGIDNMLLPDGYIGSIGVWKDQNEGTNNIYLSIDETLPNDSDYIFNIDPTTNDYYEFSLTNPSGTPGPGDIIIFWRGRDKSGLNIKCTIQLRQGDTLIAQQAGMELHTAVEQHWFQLTPAERANITDWNNLRIRIIPVEP